MKENLRKENNDEDHKENESIDFNYKMVLSKGLVKNIIKIDPYKEYKEFYKMKKDRQEKEKKLNRINIDIEPASIQRINND